MPIFISEGKTPTQLPTASGGGGGGIVGGSGSGGAGGAGPNGEAGFTQILKLSA